MESEYSMNISHSGILTEIVLVAIALIVLIFKMRETIIMQWYSMQCKKWPKTKGKIIFVPKGPEDSESDDSYRKVRSAFSSKLSYEYEIGGEIFEGENISFKISIIRNDTLTRRLAGMYEKGQEVVVHYHPKRRNISVLNIN